MKALLLLSLFVFACQSGDTVPKRDINAVKEAHAAELMAIDGVTGVYVGRTPEGKDCIGVLVVKKTEELSKKIPSSLDGYPVTIEESGTIKPMDKQNQGM